MGANKKKRPKAASQGVKNKKVQLASPVSSEDTPFAGLDVSKRHDRFLVPSEGSQATDAIDTTAAPLTLDEILSVTPPATPEKKRPPRVLRKNQFMGASSISPSEPMLGIEDEWNDFVNWVMHPEISGGNPVAVSSNEAEGREEFPEQPLGPIWYQEPQLVQMDSGAMGENELQDYEQSLINSISFSEDHPLPAHEILSPSPRIQPVSAAEELESDFDPEQNEPAFSETDEDDWDVGLRRKEHSSEFQDEAGYDSGDGHSQKKDDDEGDTWSISD